MRYLIVLLLAAGSLVPVVVLAGPVKCVMPNGAVVYQDTPCPKAASAAAAPLAAPAAPTPKKPTNEELLEQAKRDLQKAQENPHFAPNDPALKEVGETSLGTIVQIDSTSFAINRRKVSVGMTADGVFDLMKQVGANRPHPPDVERHRNGLMVTHDYRLGSRGVFLTFARDKWDGPYILQRFEVSK
jgi:hypothetical protein